MVAGPLLYYTFLAVVAALLVWRCFLVDRLLGWIVIGALAINVSGGALMGWWVQRMHGRAFTAGDEVAYQWEGARLLRSWQTGTTLVRATVGAYAPINAVVIAIAGPGHTPMRVTTAVVGTIGVAATYWLAKLLFQHVLAARLAALLAATSPILILYSWANIRDRWIGVVAVLVMIATLLLIERFSWLRLIALGVAIVVLGELRHYWGALLGWISIAGYILFAAPPLRTRALYATAVVLVVGTALWVPTDSFLAYSMRSETAMRYVSSPSAAPSGSPQAAPGGRSRAAGAGSTGEAGSTAKTGSADAGAPETDEPMPWSGPALGVPVPARPATLREALGNLRFVLFGRVRPRPDGGQFASKFLLPEALWSYLLFPIALAGFIEALRRGRRAAWVPAAYAGALISVLTYLRGDDWNTYRFRGLYWTVVLVFAAGALAFLYEHLARTRHAPPPASREARA